MKRRKVSYSRRTCSRSSSKSLSQEASFAQSSTQSSTSSDRFMLPINGPFIRIEGATVRDMEEMGDPLSDCGRIAGSKGWLPHNSTARCSWPWALCKYRDMGLAAFVSCRHTLSGWVVPWLNVRLSAALEWTLSLDTLGANDRSNMERPCCASENEGEGRPSAMSS